MVRCAQIPVGTPLAQQGFDSSNFQIDWDNEKVTCPQGYQSTKWLLGQDASGKPAIRVRFNGVTCRTCPVRSSCTKSKTEPRELTFLPQVQHIALQTRRQTQQTLLVESYLQPTCRH